MRETFASSSCKHCRNRAAALNQAILGTIQSFVVRNDADDWKRALVCGICWLESAVAINTRQLRLLLSKCKSSINGMFHPIGYGTATGTGDFSSAIVAVLPILKDNAHELRQWTLRVSRTAPEVTGLDFDGLAFERPGGRGEADSNP
jgi:hypothetical protein